MKNKLRPLHDKLVVVKNKKNNVSSGGIHLITNATDTTVQATVVAVSDGYHKGTEFHTIDVKKDEVVLIAEKIGTDVTIGNVTYTIIREEDIMAVVNV